MNRRRSTSIGWIATVCVVLASSAPCVPAADDTWAEDGRNEIAFSVSGSRNEGETGLGLGLDYERRLTRLFGVGGWSSIPPVNSGKELKVVAAPGVEVEREDGSDAFLFRIGAEYGFELVRRLSIAPSLSLDLTEDTTTVNVGVGIAWKF